MVDLPHPEGPSRERKASLRVPRSVCSSARTLLRPRSNRLVSPRRLKPVAASGWRSGSVVAVSVPEARETDTDGRGGATTSVGSSWDTGLPSWGGTEVGCGRRPVEVSR